MKQCKSVLVKILLPFILSFISFDNLFSANKRGLPKKSTTAKRVSTKKKKNKKAKRKNSTNKKNRKRLSRGSKNKSNNKKRVQKQGRQKTKSKNNNHLKKKKYSEPQDEEYEEKEIIVPSIIPEKVVAALEKSPAIETPSPNEEKIDQDEGVLPLVNENSGQSGQNQEELNSEKDSEILLKDQEKKENEMQEEFQEQNQQKLDEQKKEQESLEKQVDNFFEQQANFFVANPQCAVDYWGDRLLIFMPALNKFLDKISKEKNEVIKEEQKKRIIFVLSIYLNELEYLIARSINQVQKLLEGAKKNPFEQIKYNKEQREQQALENFKKILFKKMENDEDRSLIKVFFATNR